MPTSVRRQAFLDWLAKTFALLATGCILVAGVILAITMQSWDRVTFAELLWPNVTAMVALVALAVLNTATALAIGARGDAAMGLVKKSLVADVAVAVALAMLVAV